MFDAFILGLVQGLGEFLPISSSGHLVVAPWLFGFKDPGLGFDVALHWATLLAVVVYFRRDVWLLVKGFFRSLVPKTRDFKNDLYQRLAWLIALASVPGALIGMLLEQQAETVFRSPLLVAFTMLGFGLVLWVVDSVSVKKNTLEHIGFWHALWIGVSQAFAIIPGVSRSGSTMTTALALGFNRADAARFSFLMSIPIIFGAGLVKVSEFGAGAGSGELFVGFVTAAISGFLAIKYLLKFLTSHNFNVFVWYRVFFAAVIFGLYIFRG